MSTKRKWMLNNISNSPDVENAGERRLAAEDASLLGDLLYNAYHGTVDDEGESAEDAQDEAVKTLAGGYGDVLWDCSFILVRDNQAIGASVITDYGEDGIPLLAFSITRPGYQRQGIATHLIGCSQAALRRRGIRRLRLVVTVANTPAVNLYQKLGFEEEQPIVRDS